MAEETRGIKLDKDKAFYFGQRERLVVSLLDASQEIFKMTDGLVPLSRVADVARKHHVSQEALSQWLSYQPGCQVTTAGVRCHLK